MKIVKGFWVPDYDEALADNIRETPQFAGRATYQFNAFQKAFGLLKNFRTAIDIGAHVGLWSAMLAPCFSRVIAFEPVQAHAECHIANTTCGNVYLRRMALSDHDGEITMSIRPPNSLKACVRALDTANRASENVAAHKLDSILADSDIDLIKIDCEGYEAHVVKGGEQTIRRNKPVIIVEQKIRHVHYGAKNLEAVELLEAWGAKRRFDSHGDYFLSW